METGTKQPTTGAAPERLWRAALLPLGALILAALLLATWMGAIAAPAAQPIAPAALVSAPLAHRPAAPVERGPAGPTDTNDFDFQITKSSTPLVFTVGQNNKYVLNVSGVITNTASSPVVDDPLPVGMRIVNIDTSDKWDCGTSTVTAINCTYKEALPTGTFDSNNNKWIPTFVNLTPIIVTVNVLPTIQPTVVNTATLVTTDNITSNNTSNLTTIIDSIDLEIVKSLEPTFVEKPGDTVTYTLVVTNHGPALGTGVYVKESLPPTTELDNWLTVYSTPGTSYNTGTGIWTIGGLSNNHGTASLILNATVGPNTNGKQIQNTATISFTNKSDYNLANNTDSAFFVVGGIDIEKKILQPQVSYFVGQYIDYSIWITSGEATASIVRVSDTFTNLLSIDRNLVYVRDRTTGQKVTVGYFSVSGQTLTWNISTLAANKKYELVIPVRVNANVTEPKVVKNQAKVVWNSTNLTKFSKVIEAVVAPAPDLQVTKDDGRTEVYRGELITYTVTLDNIGSLEIGEFIVTDTYGSYLTFEELTEGSTNQDIVLIGQSGQTIVWKIKEPETLTPTDTPITFKLRFKVSSSAPDGYELQNSVKAMPNKKYGEVYFDNNIDTDDDDEVVVAPTTKLSILYEVSPTSAKVGETLTFKLEVKNTGDNSIKNLQIADTYPSVLDFGSGSSTTRGTLTTNSSDKSWLATITELKKNESLIITIVTKVNTSVNQEKVYSTRANLTWPGTEYLSNNVLFRVLPSGTLPGTGSRGTAGGGNNLIPLLFIATIGLILAGFAVLFFGMYARARHPLWAGNYLRFGIGLLAGGVLLGVAAFASSGLARSSPTLVEFSGTRAPYKVKNPTRTPQAIGAVVNGASSAGPVEPETVTGIQVIQADPNHDPNKYLPTPTPDRLPDYAIPTPTVNLPPSADGVLPDPSAVVRMVIPRINLDTVVKYVPYNGETWLIGGLKQEIAWMGDTSWPGLGSNTGLAGHVDLADGSDGPFRRLTELQAGDEVVVYTEKNVYTYKVREQVVVPDTDMSVIAPTEESQITLITCTGWDSSLRTYLKRLIVFANLLNVKVRSGGG